MGQTLLPGKIGCYFSHLAVWKLLAGSRATYGLILEDDVVFDDTFIDALDVALSAGEHWDLLRLNCTTSKLPVCQGLLGGGYRMNAYAGRFNGNGCYLLKRDVATRLIPDLGVMKLAFEYEIGQYFRHDYRLFGLEPFASHIEDNGQSQITGTNNAKVAKFPNHRRLPHFMFKAANYARRLSYLIRKGLIPATKSQLLRDVADR